jgi:branched-chain amino acid transport system ATP-binding protein
VLELDNIETFYGESQILWGVSLKVGEGQSVALLGRNGMGKTTTVRSIMGLTPPRRGRILFEGADTTHLDSYKISRLGLAPVPQGKHIFPSLSVRENLIFGMRGQGFDEEKVYSYFPILKTRAHNRGNQLSGGEQQMLAVGRALLTNPKLLVMDEPSEGLSPIMIHTIGDIILKLKEAGLSILLVEQNVPLALRVCDYVYILNQGRVVHECSKDDLASNVELQAEYIGVSKYKTY